MKIIEAILVFIARLWISLMLLAIALIMLPFAALEFIFSERRSHRGFYD